MIKYHKFTMVCYRMLFCILVWLTLAPDSHAALFQIDLGPVFSMDKGVNGNKRMRALGPIFEKQKADDGSAFLAIRPVFSSVKRGDDGRIRRDIVWPLGATKDDKDRTTWRFFPFSGWSPRGEEEVNTSSRFTIFPIHFAGKTKMGENFFALFPIGGVLKDTLFRDKISFVMFPLYIYSSINDVETWDYLWPIISRTKGDGVSRFRVFPFYGKSVRDDRWEKQFIMWPIWTSAKYSLSGAAGKAHMLFPLYGHALMEDQETWWVLPPFFKWAKGKTRTTINCPWPLFQYTSGDMKRLYFWPIWGKRSMGHLKTGFFLWPIFTWEKGIRTTAVRKRFMAFPIFYNERVIDKKDEGSVTARYTKVWPLVSYRRDKDKSRIRVPDLWPGKSYSAIERNLAPFWTLYSRVRAGESVEHEILWGLIKKRSDGEDGRYMSVFPVFSSGSDGEDSKGWKVLFGLFGYEREKLQKTYRLLYFPIRTGEAP